MFWLRIGESLLGMLCSITMELIIYHESDDRTGNSAD
jgi:hypothetical protein